MIRFGPLRAAATTAKTATTVTVSFTIRDAQGSGVDVRGTVRFGGAAVVLEFEGQAPAANGIERKVVIDVEEFAACSFRRGVLGARMQLWAIDEGALGGVPGAADDGVLLQVARHDRDAAEALAQRVGCAIDEAVTRSSSSDRNAPWSA